MVNVKDRIATIVPSHVLAMVKEKFLPGTGQFETFQVPELRVELETRARTSSRSRPGSRWSCSWVTSRAAHSIGAGHSRWP